MTRPKVYISGPLHAVKDLGAARRFYEELAAICSHSGYETYLPHQFTDPHEHSGMAPDRVFRRDRAAMRECELVLAVVGAPSSGVGAELAFAFSEDQPVIALCRADERPSRFLEGMLQSHASAVLVRFEDDASLREFLTDALARVAGATR
jgi:nucleoside 2-deoxyribosyltransferase